MVIVHARPRSVEIQSHGSAQPRVAPPYKFFFDSNGMSRLFKKFFYKKNSRLHSQLGLMCRTKYPENYIII